MMQFLNNLNGTRLGTILQTLLYISGVPLFQDSITSDGFGRSRATVFRNLEVEGPHPEDPLNTRCYGALGCITVKYPDQRGFHLFPEPLQEIRPDICLYTYAAKEKCQVVKPDSLDRLVTGKGKNSYWIAHGYIENGDQPWIKHMASELLENDNDGNVFVLDWAKGAEPPYTQAVSNIELVAAYTAHLMLMVEDIKGLNVSKVHYIGHSLGAQLGGFIGSWLLNHANEKMARITGLDPAQPYFQNYPPDTRLDPEDAEMVDVIHTDAKPLLLGGSLTGLGTQEPSGHVDFYPNSGKDQPGCKDGVYQSILQAEGSLLYGLRRFIGCDHIRSYEYFSESIRSTCSFMSFACPSWDGFLSSSCNFTCGESDSDTDRCNYMGFHAKKPQLSEALVQTWEDGLNGTKTATESVLYYSITGSRVPYCREHYLVTLKLLGHSTLRSSFNFHIVIFGSKRIVRTLKLGDREFRGGLTHQFVIGGPPMNFQFDKALLKPASTSPIWWFMSRMTNIAPDVVFSSISITHLESASETILCPEGRPFLNLSDRNPHVLLTTGACTLPTILPSFGPLHPTPSENTIPPIKGQLMGSGPIVVS